MLNEDFTEVEWVRQTDQGHQSERGVAAPVPKEPEQLPGPRARIVQERASTPLRLSQESIIASQANVDGREMGGYPRRSRNPAVGFRDEDPRTVIGAAGGYGRPGTSAGGCSGRRGPGRRQPGAGLRQGLLGSWPYVDAAVLAHFAGRRPPCVLCATPKPRSSTPSLPGGSR